MFTITGKYTTATVHADQVEPSCVAQITQMVNLPSFAGPVVIMPDCHAGKGSVIGFTMPLGASLAPAVVGVDIGCGVLAAKVPWPAGTALERLDEEIRARVPFGHEVRDDARLVEDPALRALCGRVHMDLARAQRSIGTLGGGNHFIEIGLGDTKNTWILIHSGSRQLGEKICKYHTRVAEEALLGFRSGAYQAAIEEIRATAPRTEIGARIQAYKAEQAARVRAPSGLAPLHGVDLAAYMRDMTFAQAYAARNRRAILDEVVAALGVPVTLALDTVHNYIDPVDGIIRKGAVAARSGELLVIPFNRRDGSLLCRGLGNPAWNCSAPHGAGRTMSRAEAKRTLNPVAEAASMAGVYSSCDPLDEAPGAYKLAGTIRAAIVPTVEVVEEIRPILNLKTE